ncbi:hypothetical protein NOCA2150134 [metagenome]|uniref:CHAD domain-containing protein n=1 Tax=metagenome TaxID=256318 RepID=A0A2P2C0Z8_9ZZZZ
MSLLREQVDELRRAELSLGQHATAGVHDVRVATRRLRSLVQQARPWAGDRSTDAVRADLRWLAAALSQVRDAEVVEARIRTHLWSIADPVVPPDEVAEIEQALSGAHRTAYDAALQALSTQRFPQLLEGLDALADAEPTRQVDRVADLEAQTRLIRRHWRRLEQLAGETAPTEVEHLHDVRKLTKRLRYASEPLVPAVGKDAQRFTEALKSVQALLGDHHDTVISRQRLDVLESQLGLAVTVHRVRALEEQSAAALEAEFAHTWPLVVRRVAHSWPLDDTADVYR